MSLVLRATAVVIGWTAAWVHGVDVRRCVDDPVEVTVPRSQPLAADLARQNSLVAAGWLPLRYTGVGIYQLSRTLIAQVAPALNIPVPPPARLPTGERMGG